MIPRIKKILYATDLSQNSDYVFRYALNSAEMHGAKIEIVHVLQIDLLSVFQYDVILASSDIIVPNQEKKTIILKKIKKRLDDFVKRELKDNPSMIKRVSSIHVVEGSPIVEILKINKFNT